MAISRTQAVSANANTVAITSATAGDIIVVWAYFAGTATIPSLPAGFTNIVGTAGTAQAARLGYKVSTGGETSSGVWTNATQVVCQVYRGAGSFGTTPTITAGNGTSLSYSARTLLTTDGTSWWLGFGGASSATAGMNGSPTGTLPNISNRTSQTKINGCDTGAGTATNLSAQSLNVTTTGRWQTTTIELEAAQQLTRTATDSLTTSDDARQPVQLTATDAPSTSEAAASIKAYSRSIDDELTITDEYGPAIPAQRYIDEDFEGLTEASWSTLSDTPNYDYSAAPLEGSQSLYLPDIGNACRVRSPDFANQSAINVYFRMKHVGTTPPSATTQIASFAPNGAISPTLAINLTPTMRLQFTAATCSPVTALVGNIMYHVWLRYIQGTGSNAFLELGFSTTGLKPGAGSNYDSLPTGTQTQLVGRFNLGPTATSMQGDLIFDMVRITEGPIGDNGFIFDLPGNPIAPIKIVNAPRGASDNPSFSESADAVVVGAGGAVVATTTEALSTAENVIEILIGNRTVTDAITTDEVAARLITEPRTTVDSPSVTMSVNRMVALLKTSADAISTAESITGLKIKLSTATDALTVAMTVAKLMSALRVTADNPTSSMTILRLLTGIRTTVDAISSSEVASRQVVHQAFLRDAIDAATLSELTSRILLSSRNGSDAVITADLTTRSGSYFRSFSENPTLLDLSTLSSVSSRSIDELLQVTDLASLAGFNFVRLTTDALELFEFARVPHGIRFVVEQLSTADVSFWFTPQVVKILVAMELTQVLKIRTTPDEPVLIKVELL